MSQPRKQWKFHLFNCDNLYDLSVVEDLLKAAKAKLDFEFSVEKHIFTLPEMAELSSKTIPEMKIDFAMFVVNAHESVLLINNDNIELGYSKVYRALMQATGGNVIVVIGGDDKYKDETEEEQSVISRWAWRKIAHSQFREEFIDGRKSFVFSWNEKHREIHEEALLHYFDPSKKGQKFEYQQKPKPGEESKPAQSMDEQSEEDKPISRSYSVGQRGRVLFPPSYGVGQGGQNPLVSHARSVEQSRWDSSLSRYSSAEPKSREGSTFSPSITAGQGREHGASIPNKAHLSSEQGARPKEMSASTTKLKELAILGCNVAEDSMKAAMKVFAEIAPKLNLTEQPTVENNRPDEVNLYLTSNRIKFCVLVVDINTVHDAYSNRFQQTYKELLETAAKKVVAKVIVLVCDNCVLPAKVETVIHEAIDRICRIITKTGKGFTPWLKNGKLTVEADVLVRSMETTTGYSEGFEKSTGNLDQPQGYGMRYPTERKTEYEWNERITQQPQSVAPVSVTTVTTPSTGYLTPKREAVMLKSKLYNGRISYKPEDLEILYPAFDVPDYINQKLLQEHHGTPEAGVKIVKDNDGELRLTVEPNLKDKGIQIAENETILLVTQVRYGMASFKEGDLRFIYPDFQIPQYITHGLKREYETLPCGELYIISDDQGNLRYKVKIGRGNKARDYLNRGWRRVTNFKP